MKPSKPPGRNKSKSYYLPADAGGYGLTGEGVMARRHTLSIGNQSPTPFFLDTWETGNMAATNDDGFAWDSNNATSVVSMNPDTAWCSHPTADAAYATYNNGNICNGPQTPAGGGDWYAKNGNYCLRFNYTITNHWSEQQFTMGAAYPTLWIAYWFRVPAGYARGLTGEPSNNKFAVFQTVTSPIPSGNGISKLEVQDLYNVSDETACDINLQIHDGGTDNFTNSGRYLNFMTSSDAGRWMHIVYQLKCSSSVGVTDAVIGMYRKWDGDSSYTTIAEVTGIAVDVTQASDGGWIAGYLMGYANRLYDSQMEFLIDDFALYTSDPR